MSTQPAHNIAERAYLIWEQMGRPEGKALEHWLRAEAELAAEPSMLRAKPAIRMPPRARRKRT